MSDASSKQPKLLWNPALGVVLVIALYFIAPIIGSLLVAGFDAIIGQSNDGVVAQFLFIVVVEALTVAGIIWFLRTCKTSVAALGLGRPKLKHFGLGLAVYPLYFAVFAIVVGVATRLFPGLNVDQQQQLGFNDVQGNLALGLTFISLVVLPPLVEELSVRGMIFTSLRSRLSFLWATVLTSLIFASAHLPEGGAAGPLYIAALDTFVLSLALCTLREKTGSLWPGITLHALKNGIAFFSLYILALR